MVHVNGKKVGGSDAVTKFTAYVSPYFVVSNGGAYTKHIYAADQRIASKLGNVDGFGADPRRVEMAGGKKYDDNQSGTIKARFEALNIDYSDGNGKKDDEEYDSTMDSEEKENLVFFYHPDHLGSTSYVTDADGNIAQHVEYIPYGEVFVEERNSQFSTNFLFNAKELDNETGLYYYGARYLDPTGAMWLSVDPVFHAGTSPYAYCLGNPVVMVDPDGENEYEVNPQGYVKEVNNTSEKHTLYAVDKDGNRTGSKINVKNKSILEDLTKNRSDYKGSDADGKNEKKGHYAYSKSKESMNLFVFLSDASSEVEWKLMKYKDGNYEISTTHQKNAVSLHKGKYSLFDVLFDVHSHPGSGKYGTMGGSGYDNDRRLYGDRLYISDNWETWYYANIHDVQKQLEFPCHFVYHRKSQSLFQYTPWVGSINLGKVLNRNLMPNINKHKSSLSTK